MAWPFTRADVRFPSCPGDPRAARPIGRLRASIDLENPILAKGDPLTGQVGGVSVDLARRLAQLLQAELELVVFDTAAKSVKAVTSEKADVGFFAVDSVHGACISFTAPYVLIEGCYLVRADSPIQLNDEVDRQGILVAVGKGSAYDLILTREIAKAKLVRAPTSPTVVKTFIELGLDVAAGVKQQLESDMQSIPGLRLLPGNFMLIQQAMGLPKGHDKAVAEALSGFVELAKADGFIANALKHHQVHGVSIAP